MAVSLRRILITGASGFVGGHLIPALAAAFPAATLLTPKLDLRVAASVEEVVRYAEPDACVHLAAISNVPIAGRNPDAAWQVNLHGTLRLAQAILAYVPQCLLVYASSTDIYGASFNAGTAVSEKTLLAPLNIYGATKAAADLALGAMAAEGLRVLRLRPSNHTGPGQSDSFAVPAFARQLARIAAGLQPPIMHVGNLDSSRDFLDVRDVCAAYVACLHRASTEGNPIPSGSIFNISSGVPRRIGDVLEELREIAGVAVELRADPARMRPSEIPLAISDASRANAVLGWRPTITWHQTLSDVLSDWHNRVAGERS